MRRHEKTGYHPARGEASPHAKLTDAMVREMRAALHAGTATFGDFARRWDIAKSNLSRAARGESWAHITDPPPVPKGPNGRPRTRSSTYVRPRGRRLQ